MKSIEYSILKYRYSFHLGEQINVGILFYNQSNNQLSFLHPNNLTRVTNLYGSKSSSFLRKYINSFQRQTEKINKKLLPTNKEINLFKTNLTSFIDRFYLVKDASSLIFSEVKAIPDFEHAQISIYKDLFPFEPLVSDSIEVKKDEEYIAKHFKSEVINRLPQSNFNRYFEEDVIISTDLLTERFEYGWKNGTRNLIAPISFDLNQPYRIKDKSLRWTASLSLLKEKAENENIKFDLLISQPDNPKSDVKDQISKSIARLNSINDRILKLHVDENDHLKYIQYALSNIY